MIDDVSNSSFFAPVPPPSPESDPQPDFGAQFNLPRRRPCESRRIRQRKLKAPRRFRKRRCCACGYILQRLDSWHCPRCRSDLREVGFFRPQGWVRTTIGTLVALWRRIRRRERVGPVCSNCDYPPRGIAGFACPECGADFHKVDLVDRDRIAPGVAVTFVCLMWLAVFIPVATFLHIPVQKHLVPRHVSREESMVLTMPGYHVIVRGNGGDVRSGMQAPPLLTELAATVMRENDDRYATLVIQFPQGAYQIGTGARFDPYGEGDRIIVDSIGFSGRAVGNLFQAAGLDLTDARMEAQAVELSRVLFELRDASVQTDSIIHLKATSWPKITRTGLVFWNQVELLTWIFIGIASIVFIGWRTRRWLWMRADPQSRRSASRLHA